MADDAYFLKESDDNDDYNEPVMTDEAPVDSSSGLSMQPVLAFLVLVAVVGYFIRRHVLRQQEAEDKEFNA